MHLLLSVITNVEEMVAAGEHWEGGLSEVTTMTATTVSSTFFNVAVELTEAPACRVAADGTILEEPTGGDALITLIVTADANGQLAVREGEVNSL